MFMFVHVCSWLFMIVHDCSCITLCYALLCFVMLCYDVAQNSPPAHSGCICISLSRGHRRSQAQQTATPGPRQDELNTASSTFWRLLPCFLPCFNYRSTLSVTVISILLILHSQRHTLWVGPRSHRTVTTKISKMMKLPIITHPNLHAFRFCLRDTRNIKHVLDMFLEMPSG